MQGRAGTVLPTEYLVRVQMFGAWKKFQNICKRHRVPILLFVIDKKFLMPNHISLVEDGYVINMAHNTTCSRWV